MTGDHDPHAAAGRDPEPAGGHGPRAGGRPPATAEPSPGGRRPSGDAGPAGRVAVVQGQARRSVGLAGAFAVGAVVAAAIPHGSGAWLPLHLFLVGGALLAISGASQMFAVTWAAGPPPSDGTATLQRTVLAVGTLVLTLGREEQAPRAVVDLGGALVIVALVMLAVMLVLIVRPAVQRRFDPSLRWYLVALLAGVVGCCVGLALASSTSTRWYPRLRGAHMTLNLLGLVGLVIAGTLPFFAATEARVKMSPRARPAVLDGLLGAFTVALVLATLGFLVDNRTVAVIGLAGYAAAVGTLGMVMPTLGRKQLSWAGPRLVQMALGIAWWAGAVIAAAVGVGRGHMWGEPVVLTLVVGGFAQVLVASLAYLGPVLRGGGHVMLSAGFRVTRSWPGLVVVNAAAIAFAFDARTAGWVLVALWVLDSGVRAARLLALRPSGSGSEPAAT